MVIVGLMAMGLLRQTVAQTPGTIVTFAGGGVADGGPATSAGITPHGLATDPAGNLYFADLHNGRVRKVTPDGRITTAAGKGWGIGGDGGPATEAQLMPVSVTLDGGGSLYVASGDNVRKISPDGIITNFAGTGIGAFSGDGGPATNARLNSPSDVVADANGSLYIADSNNLRVRKVSPDGIITTVAGNGKIPFNGDGIPAKQAALWPVAVATDREGSLYIADAISHRVRKVSPDGIITTVAGNGTPGSTGDGGRAVDALLISPSDLAFDAEGSLYIADSGNHRRDTSGRLYR
jgi:sugar lactone lactonase YvrE